MASNAAESDAIASTDSGTSGRLRSPAELMVRAFDIHARRPDCG